MEKEKYDISIWRRNAYHSKAPYKITYILNKVEFEYLLTINTTEGRKRENGDLKAPITCETIYYDKI